MDTPNNPPDYYWNGQKIRLRAVEPEDGRAFFDWQKETKIHRNRSNIALPTSLTLQREWAARTTKLPLNDEFMFIIENKDHEMVGQINTHTCNRRIGHFKFAISVLKKHQRKGYASEAIQIVLKYFFEELRYQKVTSDIHSFNRDSIQLHEKFGFLKEGCVRRVIYTGGKFYDSLFYGMTCEEFLEKHPCSKKPE